MLRLVNGCKAADFSFQNAGMLLQVMTVRSYQGWYSS